MIEKRRPVSSGSKSTRRTGAAESCKSVATFAAIEQVQFGSAEVPTEEQFEALLIEKPKVFREQWHSNEPFYLACLSDLAQRDRRCQACSLEFPDEVDPESVENLLVAHKEVYQYPDTIQAGKNVWVWSTRAMRLHYIHACYSCIISRYPYFWSGLLKADNAVRRRLSGDQINHANQQLAFFIDRDPLS